MDQRVETSVADDGVDDGQERLARLVRNAARAYVRGLQLRLEPHDVNYGHWSVLRVLWAQDGLSQRDLSEQAGITDSTTFAVVKSLEALGYVERRHLPGNNKNVHVFLTRSGKALKRQLIPLAVELGVPLLAICRGFQEVNVAFGGSLYQKVHEQPGFMDHRENKDDPLDVQYGPAHDVALVPGGVLAGLVGGTQATVKSLHGQGVRRLGDRLVVEAQAPDGLIEAFRHDGPAFMLAVQWHPEWKVADNPFYLAIFRAFGDACRARAQQRGVTA